MGRLIAGVIALAIGVLGAMYWGQAQQADASQHLPLVPSIEAPAAMVDNKDAQSGADQCPYMKEQCQQACPEGKGSCSDDKGCGGGGCCKRNTEETSTT